MFILDKPVSFVTFSRPIPIKVTDNNNFLPLRSQIGSVYLKSPSPQICFSNWCFLHVIGIQTTLDCIEKLFEEEVLLLLPLYSYLRFVCVRKL